LNLGVPAEGDIEPAHPDSHWREALRVPAVYQVLPAEGDTEPAHPDPFW